MCVFGKIFWYFTKLNLIFFVLYSESISIRIGFLKNAINYLTANFMIATDGNIVDVFNY